jgi:hypothetical protein
VKKTNAATMSASFMASPPACPGPKRPASLVPFFSF